MQEEKIRKEKVEKAAVNGKLSCAGAFKLAQEMECPVKEIGRLANELNIKIVSCQLGCF